MTDDQAFKAGDKVLVNGGTVAEIFTYDERANNLVYKIADGNSVNYVQTHVSNTRLEHLPSRLDPEGDAVTEVQEGHSVGLPIVNEETPEAGEARVNAVAGDVVTAAEQPVKRGPGRPRKDAS